MLSTTTILDALKAAHNTPGIKPMQLIVMKESLLSSRITLFSDGKEKWALAMEKVIMSTNGVQLQTNFYGNCYQIPALKQDADFSNMMVEDLLNILDCEADWDGDYMPENPSPWMMRGISIELEQDPAVIAESVPWCNGEQISLMDQLCYLAATKKICGMQIQRYCLHVCRKM
ncbi:hypothetical protein MKQ70_08485 [Chitinophaga sedimenti]|uniref:DUF7003 family protein n=1 Tax=Chitinophaga sedimenti TaxID=2033606 RepID=UPI002005CF0B|nr:hypothetical protein [Chitinophaga sedimenti]MCK7555043.1 hypothetical protein [Chitinophaga sedimenti]